MSYPGQVFEDPAYYDDDGFCVDEDADWEDAEPTDVMDWLVNQLKDYDASYSPFDTINS